MKFQTNKTKLIALMLLLCTVTLMFSSCTRDKIDKPADTNLEYWLLDRPKKEDLTLVGENMYLSKNYQPIINEDGSLSAPEEYVAYSFHKYPFNKIGIERILKIVITDPNVSVWGLTINSTKEEIVEVFSKMGFYIDGPWDERCDIRNKKIEISIFYNERIEIQHNIISISNSIYFGQISYQRSFPFPKN